MVDGSWFGYFTYSASTLNFELSFFCRIKENYFKEISILRNEINNLQLSTFNHQLSSTFNYELLTINFLQPSTMNF